MLDKRKKTLPGSVKPYLISFAVGVSAGYLAMYLGIIKPNSGLGEVVEENNYLEGTVKIAETSAKWPIYKTKKLNQCRDTFFVYASIKQPYDTFRQQLHQSAYWLLPHTHETESMAADISIGYNTLHPAVRYYLEAGQKPLPIYVAESATETKVDAAAYVESSVQSEKIIPIRMVFHTFNAPEREYSYLADHKIVEHTQHEFGHIIESFMRRQGHDFSKFDRAYFEDVQDLQKVHLEKGLESVVKNSANLGKLKYMLPEFAGGKHKNATTARDEFFANMISPSNADALSPFFPRASYEMKKMLNEAVAKGERLYEQNRLNTSIQATAAFLDLGHQKNNPKYTQLWWSGYERKQAEVLNLGLRGSLPALSFRN